MRSSMALVLVVGLVGCASPPPVNVAKSGDQGGPRVRALNIPALGDGIFHCAGPGAGNPFNRGPKCSEIPVIVLETDQTGSGCASLLPYNELKAHVGPNKPQTDITWVLVAPDGYKFSSSNVPREFGVAITNPGPTYIHVGDVSTGNTQKYRWTVVAGAAYNPSGLDHQAHVVSPTGVKCTPIDPKIINIE